MTSTSALFRIRNCRSRAGARSSGVLLKRSPDSRARFNSRSWLTRRLGAGI